MSDIDLVIRRSREIEEILVNRFGARGKGLHEKLTSVERGIPSDLCKQIRWIATMRNQVVHTNTTLPDPAAYDQTSLRVIARLHEIPLSQKRIPFRWWFWGTIAVLFLISGYAVSDSSDSAPKDVQIPTAYSHTPTSTTTTSRPIPVTKLLRDFGFTHRSISLHVVNAKENPLPVNAFILHQRRINGRIQYQLQAEIFDATLHSYRELRFLLRIDAGGLHYLQEDRVSFSPAITSGQFRRIWLSLGHRVSRLETTQRLPLQIVVIERIRRHSYKSDGQAQKSAYS